MCRVLSYLGPPVLLDELLYKPDSSLVRQSYAPQQLSMLNLGGFGMVAWDPESPNPHKPWTYRSTELPVFDANLKAMAMKARAGACSPTSAASRTGRTRASGRTTSTPSSFRAAAGPWPTTATSRATPA